MSANNSKLNNTVMVYVSSFDSNTVVGEVEPAIRNDIIRKCSDTLIKQQRYCVWQLLDYALRSCYGKGVKDLNFYIDDSGKWNCSNGVYFSLAHCNNVVAVAMCNHCVGVDVESVENFVGHVNDEKFTGRVLTEGEQKLLQNVPIERRAETLAEMWTKKESIFKLQGGKAFVPKSIDTANVATHSQLLTINGEQYALSVVTHVDCDVSISAVDNIFAQYN